MLATFKKLKPIKKTFITLLVSLSVVMCWRGAWGVLDTYLLPNNLQLSYAVSLILGLILLGTSHFVLKIEKEQLTIKKEENIKQEKL